MTSIPVTYLFVPGNRPERFAKALASGADRIILDLEDAVTPPDKVAARLAVAQWFALAGDAAARVVLRINGSDSAFHAEDLLLLSASPWPCVLLPKCESAAQVVALRPHLHAQASALSLIESARGVMALASIAAAPGVERLAFGSLDYMLDLDIPALRDAHGNSSLALDIAATQIAQASRAAGLAPPVAGVTPEIDAARVQQDMLHARSLGYGAKMCIHPAQIAAVLAALQSSAGELAWAQRVVDAAAASQGAALLVDGRMVDRPVLEKSRRLLALAARAPGTTD